MRNVHLSDTTGCMLPWQTNVMQGTVLCFYEITWIRGTRARQSGEPVQLIRHRVQSGDGKSDGIIIICIIIMKAENRLSAGLKNCNAPDDGEQGFSLEACELIFSDFGSDTNTITTTDSDTLKTKVVVKCPTEKCNFEHGRHFHLTVTQKASGKCSDD